MRVTYDKTIIGNKTRTPIKYEKGVKKINKFTKNSHYIKYNLKIIF